MGAHPDLVSKVDVDASLASKADQDFTEARLRRLDDAKADKSTVEASIRDLSVQLSQVKEALAARAQTVDAELEKQSAAASARAAIVDAELEKKNKEIEEQKAAAAARAAIVD